MNTDEMYLKHILDAIEKIEAYTSVGRATFLTASHWQDATIRQLEIIGEAARLVSAQTKDEHPEIPWKQMIGMRNRLVHEYSSINFKTVWDTINNDLPTLIALIEPLVPPED